MPSVCFVSYSVCGVYSMCDMCQHARRRGWSWDGVCFLSTPSSTYIIIDLQSILVEGREERILCLVRTDL